MLTCKENLYTDVLGSSESNLRNVWLFLNSCRHHCIPRSCSIVVKKNKAMLIHFLLIYVSCYHLCAAAYAGFPNSTTWSDIKVLFASSSWDKCLRAQSTYKEFCSCRVQIVLLSWTLIMFFVCSNFLYLYVVAFIYIFITLFPGQVSHEIKSCIHLKKCLKGYMYKGMHVKE